MPPLYLLDGQQRLTSLCRVMNDHPEAQVVFNVETEAFQNQSAATGRDGRWAKVYDLLRPDADLIEVLERFDYDTLKIDRREAGKRLQRLMAVPKYGYHMQVIADLPYEEVLGQDIPAARGLEPVKSLLANLGLAGAPVEVTPSVLTGRTSGSPYFFLSFLVCKARNARDWFHGTGIDLGGQDGHKLEYHHIHPRATLKDRYTKGEINDLANLAFISASANRQISDRSPEKYFLALDPADLAAHLVPTDDDLRTAGAYPRFLAARRSLLAAAMTEFLNGLRPAWLDQMTPEPTDELGGSSLELTWYDSAWDEPKLAVCARDHDHEWRAVLSAIAFEEAVAQAATGISTDIAANGQQLAVRSDSETIEMELGPFLVVGGAPEWNRVIERERADARPLSQAPTLDESATWDGPRRRFPVASSE